VIYIVKENRTYDQVFGSLGKGNGDPSLNLFGEESAPNQRRPARDFVTLDNFYVDGAVSSDGWEWATASESNSYNEHLWPVAYGGRGRGDDVYTNPATDPGKITGDSRIWDRLDDAGVSYRNYGMWAGGSLPAKVFPTEPRPAGHTDTAYAANDQHIRDASRVEEWDKEFDGFVRDGRLPTMQFVRLATTTPPGPLPGCRRRGRWSPTTIWPSDGSWTRCRTVPTGGAPRSSSPRTTRRTAPTTSTPTAPRRWS
jgi:hypothetical protein